MPASVVINDILPYTQSIAMGGQTVFSTDWTANYESDVVVYLTPALDAPDDATQQIPYPSGYSVVFIGSQNIVQVTLVVPAALGDIVTITRQTPADRQNLYSNTNFTPSMLNNDFGILTFVDQQAQLVNQKIGPRYNYSAQINVPVDTILPILAANQLWAKDENDTAIIAIDVPQSGIGAAGATYLTTTPQTSILPNSSVLEAGQNVTLTTGANSLTISVTGSTIVSGLQNQIAWYANDGSVLSGLTIGNNGVLITNNAGVPSWLANSPTDGFVLTANLNAPPTWQSIGAIGAIITINCDTGSAVTDDGMITISGGTTGLTTTGSLSEIDLIGTLNIGHGGTGLTALPLVPAASTFAAWDANSNLLANNFLPNYASIATAAGTTVLTAASAYYQFFTGTTTQTVTLPVASTMRAGQSFYVVNRSTGVVTIQSSGGNNVQAMVAGTSALITCILTSGTTAASWFSDYAFNGGSGSGTVNSGTANQLAFYATTGVAVSGLTSANNSGLITNGSGLPGWVAYTGTGAPMLNTSPRIITSILDTNGNTIIGIGAVASAVNYVSINNGVSGANAIVAANGADTNIILALLGKGNGGAAVQGNMSGNQYASGFVGELKSSVITFTSSTPITNNITTALTSLSLTAGDWDVWGNIGCSGSTVTLIQGGITTAGSAIMPNNEFVTRSQPNSVAAVSLPVLQQVVNVATTTSVYLNMIVNGTGSLIMYGTLYARRR